MAVARDRLVVAAFVTTALLAGANGVGIRFSNRELDPMWGATLRFCSAALIMLAIFAAMRLSLPRGRAMIGAVLYGILNFGAGYGLAYYSLTRLHAGFGQTLLALVPLMTLLLAVAWRQERLRARAVAGSLLALAGVALMSREPLRAEVPVLALVTGLISAFSVAQAAVLVRRYPPVHPVAMNAVGMAAGGALLLAATLIAGETMALPDRAETWGAIAYMVVMGSVAVFLLYLYVLGRWEASRAAYLFVLLPPVTLSLSAWLDGEPLGPGLLAGGALVLAGVHFGALRAGSGPASRAEPQVPIPGMSRH